MSKRVVHDGRQCGCPNKVVCEDAEEAQNARRRPKAPPAPTIAARLDEAVGLLRRAHAVIEPGTYNDSTVCSGDINAFLAAIDAEKAREGT